MMNGASTLEGYVPEIDATGGSSSGSGALLAAGEVDLAIAAE